MKKWGSLRKFPSLPARFKETKEEVYPGEFVSFKTRDLDHGCAGKQHAD